MFSFYDIIFDGSTFHHYLLTIVNALLVQLDVGSSVVLVLAQSDTSTSRYLKSV